MKDRVPEECVARASRWTSCPPSNPSFSFFFNILPKKNRTELMTITGVDENRLKLQSNHLSTRIGRNIRSGKKLAIQKLPGHRLFHSRERERERGNENEKSSRNRGSTERENEEKAAIWNLTETFVKWLGRRRMIDEDATSLDRAATWKNDGAALPRNPIKPRANQRRDIYRERETRSWNSASSNYSPRIPGIESSN